MFIFLVPHICWNNLGYIVAECLFPLSDENQASNEKVSKISPSLYQIWSHLGKMQLTYHGLRSKVANPEFSDLIKRRKNEMRDEIRRRILLSSQTDLFNDFCHIIFRLQIRFFNKLMKIFSYIPDLSFLVGATKNLFFCSEERNAYSAPNNIGTIISETKSFLSQNDSEFNDLKEELGIIPQCILHIIKSLYILSNKFDGFPDENTFEEYWKVGTIKFGENDFKHTDSELWDVIKSLIQNNKEQSQNPEVKSGDNEVKSGDNEDDGEYEYEYQYCSEYEYESEDDEEEKPKTLNEISIDAECQKYLMQIIINMWKRDYKIDSNKDLDDLPKTSEILQKNNSLLTLNEEIQKFLGIIKNK